MVWFHMAGWRSTCPHPPHTAARHCRPRLAHAIQRLETHAQPQASRQGHSQQLYARLFPVDGIVSRLLLMKQRLRLAQPLTASCGRGAGRRWCCPAGRRTHRQGLAQSRSRSSSALSVPGRRKAVALRYPGHSTELCRRPVDPMLLLLLCVMRCAPHEVQPC